MLKSNNIKKGFTIIEVIIVLVIAAIIMLAVFLVVPQLQRSAANNGFQSNARSALAAAQQWYSNNPGAASGPTNQNIKDIAGQFRDASNALQDPITTTSMTPTPGPGWVVVVTNAKCGTSGTTQSGSSANTTTASGSNYANYAIVVGLVTSAPATTPYSSSSGSNSYYCINN